MEEVPKAYVQEYSHHRIIILKTFLNFLRNLSKCRIKLQAHLLQLVGWFDIF